MDPSHVIDVDNLHRHYHSRRRPDFDAVRGISFSVRRGELFALLGTNGSGKTSTMEVLEGLAAPSAGTVRILGHDPHRARRLVRPRIGILLQEGGLPGDLTVAETTRMWAGTLTSPRPVEEALDIVDLRSRASVAVKQLSGGEKRRLDLALAVLGRPEVLFLDEPTAGLDPEGRARTWTLISDLVVAGTTVLLTTHYLQEAADLADRVAILHRGRVVSSGTPAELAASKPARISFVMTAREPIPSLPGVVSIEEHAATFGRHYVVQTEDLQQALHALLRWAGQAHVVLDQLDARSASLEEAFLSVAASADDPSDQLEVSA